MKGEGGGGGGTVKIQVCYVVDDISRAPEDHLELVKTL